MLDFILSALIYIFPAYVANASALLFGFGSPIDGNKNFFDGKPLLGKGKTWKGLFAGTCCGTLVGYVLYTFFPITNSIFLLSFLLSFGALFGDIFFSFIKRRINLKRGQPLPFIDQTDFVFGAILLTSLIYLPSIETIIFLLVLTPILHLATNFIAYLLKLKDKPY